MSVSSTTNRVSLVGNGSTVVFAYPYYFFNQADLVVNIYDTLAGSSILQVLNTNYTVSGTPNASGLYVNGANILMSSSVVSTSYVVIDRNPSQVQNFNLAQNGQISSTALNQQFDYLTLIIQHLEDKVNRCIGLPEGDGSGFRTLLPVGAAVNPNAAILVDNAGKGLAFGAVVLQGSSSSSVVGVVPVANGGTGTSTAPNPYGVVTGNSLGNSYTSTPTPQAGLPLIGQGSSAVLFQQLNLATAVTGVLPEANGGTGLAATYNQYGVLYGSSVTQVTSSAPGGSGTMLFGRGSSAPSFSFFGDGTVALPAMTFTSETNTGWLRNAAKNPQLAVGGFLGLDALLVGSSINFAFGNTAGVTPQFPFYGQGLYNGPQYFQYGNTSTGALSGTVFQIFNGAAALNNSTTIENWNYLAAGYLAGGSAIAATLFMTGLNIIVENAAGKILFNVGGRTAATEKMQITGSSVIFNKGVGMTLTGSSANTVQWTASNVGSSSVLVVNTGGGAVNSVWTNDGNNNVSWQPGIVPVSTVTSQTAAYNALATDNIILVGSGCNSVNLFGPSGNTGKILTLTKTAAGNQVVITGSSATSTIQGSSLILANQYESTTIVDDGTNWQISALRKVPTVQLFTAVGSSVFTTPGNALYLRVKMVGSGGGGGGGGSSDPGNAGNGMSTTFGTSLLACNGGNGGQHGSGTGAVGGAPSVAAPAISVVGVTGGSGGGAGASATATDYSPPGQGGASALGGTGYAGAAANAGGNGVANTGGGGGGGSDVSLTSANAGSGGGAGAYIEAIIPNPTASYNVGVPAGGAGAGPGTSGSGGGNGGSGMVSVEVFYN